MLGIIELLSIYYILLTKRLLFTGFLILFFVVILLYLLYDVIDCKLERSTMDFDTVLHLKFSLLTNEYNNKV